MRHVFWLRPNLIAGRCGPDRQAWLPQELAASGISAVLSVNDAASVYPDELAAAGIEHRCIPISSNAPPRAGDLEICLAALPQCLEYLQAVIECGGIPLVHCSSGKDRTGLVLCHYLCTRESMSARGAIEELRRVRPLALSAQDYESFARDVLTRLRMAAGDGA